MKKNILVQYKGGGYDGCFWEWNFFSFDQNSDFFNLHSTGYKGIKTKEQALEIIESASQQSHIYIYDLSKQDDIDSFISENNPAIVVSIVDMLNQSNVYGVYPLLILWKCDHCGGHFQFAEEAIFEEWHGIGGFASQPEKVYCLECYSLLSCSECNEFIGKEGTGDDCLESLIEKAIKEYRFVEYDSFSNTFIINESPDIDEIRELNLFKVNLDHTIYLVGAENENLAIEYCAHIQPEYAFCHEVEPINIYQEV